MPLFRSCCAEQCAVPPSPVSLFGTQGEWSDWSRHPVLDEYDPIEECGRGGFSKVRDADSELDTCSVWKASCRILGADCMPCRRMQVYKATRRKDGKFVALKVLFKKVPEITTDDLALLRGEVSLCSHATQFICLCLLVCLVAVAFQAGGPYDALLLTWGRVVQVDVLRDIGSHPEIIELLVSDPGVNDASVRQI